MLTKEQVWNSIAKDLEILKHLASKVKKDRLDYKPTEKQRTTLELLQYLAFSGIASLKVILSGDSKIYSEYTEKRGGVNLSNFAEMINKQEAEMKECFAEFTDEELNKEVDLWGSGHAEKKSDLILSMIIKSIAAYKMQLFLYIKASGDDSIGTSNVWQGKDSVVQM